MRVRVRVDMSVVTFQNCVILGIRIFLKVRYEGNASLNICCNVYYRFCHTFV